MTAELENKGCKYSEDQQFNMWFWRYVSKLNIFLKCASGSGVEHHLAKVGAAGSNPVSRFDIEKNIKKVVDKWKQLWYYTRVAVEKVSDNEPW